ncbi:PQQ-dependent sugar dehydrogenase [Labrys wisconsinensis]|uniref:Glucose/arabinose dehydrogenase n=1 Tax=Labrys wisconsinensis TaxID=425677 RepID=A0ABU0JJM9_9HYPH|nr:PQQ-dependent sugar dehydrogenase [Labrys wisconsinensis]MDQ0473474.1 glucose/arabinose dehydrogenase [Labrys wisconsinensis]
MPRRPRWATFLAVFALAGAAAAAAGAELQGPSAFGDWHADAPGVRRSIRTGDLPAPSEASAAAAELARRPVGAAPRVPEGFRAELVAAGLSGPRVIRVAPNGDIFVAESRANRVRVLRLAPGRARPEQQAVFAEGLHQPYGIAFYPPGPRPQWVYVANSNGVVRFAYKDGDMTASGKPETIVSGIPEVHHWTRDLVFSADGRTMYLAVGSGSNVAEGLGAPPSADWAGGHALGAAWGGEARRADVLAFDPDGRNERILATGLRNCSGMALQPATGGLWCVVNERDGLGDDTPFDYATEVKPGAFYGWPWYYIGANEDRRHRGARPDLAQHVSVPDVLFQAHSAPLGIAFYTGEAFPPDYRGDAFVTFHGSWNRGRRTGYKVVRLPFRDGRPTGDYEDFLTGMVVSDDAVWGRPVGVAMAADGALLVSEDGNGTIWRIAYAGKT